MNKTKIKQLVKETLEATLNEDAGYDALVDMGKFLAKLSKIGEHELADELDKILVRFPEEWSTAANQRKDLEKREPSALMKKINQWDEEGKKIPKHLTVGRMSEPLQEQYSLGAGRTIEEVWQSLQDNAFQAHKDLQMLAIHLGNAKYTTQEVDDAVDTLEGMLLMLNQDVRRDVRQVAEKR